MSEKSPSFEGSLKTNPVGKPQASVRAIHAFKRGSSEIPNDPYFKKTLKVSLYLHVGAFVLVAASSIMGRYFHFNLPWSHAVEMNASKTAIRVDLVDLPSLKLSELNKVDALDKIAPDAGKTESDSVMKIPDTKEIADAKLEAEKKLKKTESQKSAKERLKELQQNLRADARRQEAVDKLKNDMAKKGQGGRPLLAGNQVSAGYATQGELATATDVYNGQLRQHLRQFWQLPGWMTASKLRARMLVKIAPDGRVIEQKFLQKSGNAEFDSAVDQAVQKASPFPAPAAGLAQIYMEEGVEWGFPE